MSYNKLQRRYDVDWLRTISFGVLILYHVGMYYVADWGWHIKSNDTYSWLQDIMMLTNPWRMSLLFFISGLVLAIVQQKYSAIDLVKLRSKRLMLPLLFGMFVICVPQIYFEALSQNLIKPGFFEFWWEYSNPRTELLKEHHTVIGLLTWNHLWFLPYLWLYSCIFIVFHKQVKKLGESEWLSTRSNLLVFISVILGLALLWVLVRKNYPPTNALVNDWYNHGKYLLAFSFGYLFVLQKQRWDLTVEKRRLFLLLGILTYSFIVLNMHGVFGSYAQQMESNNWIRLGFGIVFSVNHWAWIFCVVGFASILLNRPSKQLSYASDAILPWYILHQTLIIVFAWWLKPLDLNPLLEATLLILFTTFGCLIGYEIIKRNKVLRLVCGLKA